jgi:hypothetical protein
MKKLTLENLNRMELAKAIKEFAKQKPGFSGLDYANHSDFQRDYYLYKKDANYNRSFRVEEILSILEKVDDHIIISELGGNRRLYAEVQEDGTMQLKYNAGQYYPIEYQQALRDVLDFFKTRAERKEK